MAGRPANSPKGGSSISFAARSIARRDRRPQLLGVDGVGDGEHVARERVGGVAAVAGLVEVLQAGRLQLLEAGVGEVGDLLVVAGEDHGVAGEVGRVAVVVEVVEVGEEEHGVAGRRPRPGPPPRRRRRPRSKVRSSSAAPVRSRKLSSSRAVRPLNQRLGEASSSAT